MESREQKNKRNREYSKRKREELNYLVEINCKICQQITTCKAYKLKHFQRRGGTTCKKCLNELSSKTLKNIQANQTTEEKTYYAKLARQSSSAENRSNGVRKQWKNFRENPQKYKEICEKRVNRTKEIWKNYSEETKKRIIKQLYSSHNKSRSKFGEAVKNLLIQLGYYDGFESEYQIDKYVTDECHPSKKIIIEAYGDVYHCNPRKYQDENQFLKIINRTIKEQRDRDQKRITHLKDLGYKILIIWEYDFNKKLEETKQKIHKFFRDLTNDSSQN